MLDRFISFINKNHLFTKKDRLLLAVSGGIDSVVLCDLCKQAGFDFGIAHCNFQLRGEDSSRDESFVKSYAAALNVPLYSIQFETKEYATKNALSTQEAARVLRYNWFELIRIESASNFILTAHHADDNIETVMMNFFRGTGIAGLSGIKLVNGNIRRPLLFARRTQLEAHLKEHNLSFVQDETNLHDDYTRNYFRNTLLPQISKVYPQVQQNLLRNVERMKDVEAIYNNRLSQLYKKLVIQKGEEFLIPVLLLQRTEAMPTVLLEIVKPFGFKATQLSEIIRLLASESGRYIVSGTHRILKDRKHLIITAIKENTANSIVIDGEGIYSFPLGKLIIKYENGEGILKSESAASLDASKVKYPLLLRPWRQGDYFYPLGMSKKKKLSKFFIDQKLSLVEKEKVWVIEMDKKIIWVIGYRVDNRFKVTDTTLSVLQMQFIP